jgi:uncharacterized protein YndB with AHSA1/START domain
VEVDVDGNVVSVERVIPAQPEAIFDVIADASRHPEIDGSGTVKGAKDGNPQRLELGSTFGMSMRQGISYPMVSTVIEFEKDKRLAWQSVPPGFLGKLFGGRIWRYELEPADGGTLVRESWDVSRDHQRSFLKMGKMAETTRSNMEKTLERIEEVTSPPA